MTKAHMHPYAYSISTAYITRASISIAYCNRSRYAKLSSEHHTTPHVGLLGTF